MRNRNQSARPGGWFDSLTHDESQFVKKFLLSSGSLKDLAVHYGVSYPTLRKRLNDLIEKVDKLENEQDNSPVHRAVRELVRTDRLSVKSARSILDAYASEQKGQI